MHVDNEKPISNKYMKLKITTINIYFQKNLKNYYTCYCLKSKFPIKHPIFTMNNIKSFYKYIMQKFCNLTNTYSGLCYFKVLHIFQKSPLRLYFFQKSNSTV